MNGGAQYDGGEALRVCWRFVIVNLNLDQSVRLCIFLQTNSTVWYRKKKWWRFTFYQEYGKKQVSQSGETKEKQV